MAPKIRSSSTRDRPENHCLRVKALSVPAANGLRVADVKADRLGLLMGKEKPKEARIMARSASSSIVANSLKSEFKELKAALWSDRRDSRISLKSLRVS